MTRGFVVGQFESVLKGRGFSRAVNASKSIAALSRCGDVFFKLTHYRKFVQMEKKPAI
jgi:hypothetical protein